MAIIIAIMAIPIITIAIMAIAVSQPIAWVGAITTMYIHII